jgi:membrane-bound lytic murein transglycosylase B
MITSMRFTFAILVCLMATGAAPAHADAAFQHWLQSTWPEAHKLGVSRAVFDKAIRGLEPDYSLPDLAIPGKPEKPLPGQPEFVQTPGRYLRERSFDRLAAQGKKLAAQYHDALARIEKEFGVPGNVVLAIWARETDYGGYTLNHDASLCRQAQGLLPQRIPARLEDAAGRRAARVHAVVLGRRHRNDPIPALGVLQIRRRF